MPSLRRMSSSRMSWCGPGAPSASCNAENATAAKRRPSVTICDTFLESEPSNWAEAKVHQAEAKAYVADLARETKFFKPEREALIPQFDTTEIARGVLLGRGGFCAVHEVKNIVLQDPKDMPPRSTFEKEERKLMSKLCIRSGESRYAVKKLAVNGEEDPTRYTKGHVDLAIEMKFLAVIDHPHIIKIRAVSRKESCTDNYFILLDRLYDTLETRVVQWKRQAHRARSLKRKLFGGIKLNDALTASRLVIAYDICSAICHMHENMIIYRDLKPENIGFDIRDDVKVFDLGLAKEIHPKEAMKDGTYRLTGMTGSLRYMAPEVALKKSYNFSADTYSFGILLHQIISMETPYRGFNIQLHRDLVIGRGVRPTIPDKWPDAWASLVRRCWSKDLFERPRLGRVLDELRSNVYVLQGGQDPALDVSRRTNKSIERMLESGGESTRSLVTGSKK